MKVTFKIVLVMVVCFLLFQDLRVNTAYSSEQPTSTASKAHSKLLFLSPDYLCFLNTAPRQVSLYNMQMERWYKWSVALPEPPLSSELGSIALLNDKVFILDVSQAKVLIFKLNGSPLGFLQGAAAFLENPTAMTVMGDKIYVVQDRFIWVLDELGYLLDVKEFAGSSALSPWITHMTSDGNMLYLCDQANHQIYYGINSFKRRGYFGSQQGQFQAFAGMAVNGNWVLSDPLQERVQLFHPAYETWTDLSEFLDLPSKPLSLALSDKTLFVTTALSDEVSVIPLSKMRQTPSALLSAKEIDLGNNLNASDSVSFSVVSANGFPIRGTLSCAHPGVRIRTPEFYGSINQLSLSLIPDKIAMNSSVQAQVQVLIEGGETHSIDLRFSRNDQAGINLGSSDWSKITDTQPEVKLYIYSQNELEGSFELDLKDLSESFNLKLDQDKIDISKNKSNKIIFSAKAKKNLPSGLYPFQLTLRSKELKIQRQYTRYIAYASSESSSKKTMLAELFTATWCGYCPSAEKALHELDQQYTNDDLLFLSYYLACKDEGSDLLCQNFGSDRATFYKATGTPVFFLDGILRKDGGIANLEDSMFQAYDAMFKERMHLRSPLSLNAVAMFDIEQTFLKVMIRAELLQNLENTDPLRLFTAISEKEVLFKGKNKNEEHHHVARWMQESQGQELRLEDGSAFSKKGQVVELSFDIPLEAIPEGEWQLMSWVQDLESNEIFQSTLIPLKPSTNEYFRWKQEENIVSWFPEQAQKHTFVLSHFGEGIGTFQLKPFLSEAYEIIPEQWSVLINGVAYPFEDHYEANLMPGQSLEFSILASPMDKLPESMGVYAINVLSKEEKRSIAHISSKIAQESCKLEVIYPGPNSVVDVSSLYLLLKTEADAKLIAPSSSKYLQGGSLIAVPVSLYAGNNQIKLFLECSNGEKTEINFDIRYLLNIQLHIGKLEARHNRNTVQLDAVPFIKEARTMVPLRFIAEAFGASVLYDAVSKNITIRYSDKEMVFVPGSKKVYVNGQLIELDVSATIVNQRTFLPLRFVSEQFGAQVSWQAETQGITIEVK